MFVTLFALSLVDTSSARVGLASRRTLAQSHMEGRSDLRVIHGRDAEYDEFPFVVSLEYIVRSDKLNISVHSLSKDREKTVRVCTGSLISPTWVLTAAHCTVGKKKERLIVRYNDVMIPFNSGTSHHSRVLTIEKHHCYNERIGENDVALLLIEEAIVKGLGRLSAVEYIGLIGLPVTYAGFGGTTRYGVSGDKKNLPLKVGEGGVVPCGPDIWRHSVFPTKLICVVAKCSNIKGSTYYGDSGGPLISDGQIVGVVFSGIYNERNPRHDHNLYTPISPFLDWIRRTVARDKNNKRK